MSCIENMKRTPLYEKHLALSARMVPFGGWDMPVQYTEGILAEHKQTRENVSLFDICHMGEFRVTGPNAIDALDKIFARPVYNQKIGVCRYNFLLTDQGTVMDDLIIYRLDEEEFLIVVNAGTIESDASRIKSLLPDTITFTDESDITAKLDLQGPKSVDVLEKLGLKKEELPTYFKWSKTDIQGIPCLISRTGYTGELGFEIYTSIDNTEKLWDILLAQEEVKPAGLGARDTLRLEMGYALYGHELNRESTPVEAGFAPFLKLDEDREFAGSSVLKSKGPSKTLVAIQLDGRRAAREGAEVLYNGNKIGVATSGAFSPSLEISIAMAYISSGEPSEPGTEVELSAGRGTVTGVITELPFYKGGTVRISLV